MRGLSLDQQQLLSDFAETEQIDIPPLMLEKDILVREAILAVKDVGKDEGCQMVFCGGTSLSQAHCVIERMSEDADFRIVTPEDMSNSARRKLLSRVKHEMEAVLDDAGFPLAKPMTARNDNAYLMGEFLYDNSFPVHEALRPFIKLEVTAFAPLSSVIELPLRTIIDRVAGIDTPTDSPTMPVVSLADTLADKIVGYLRRNAQERDHETRGEYDDRLVRHIHDTHAVLSHLQSIDSFDVVAFRNEVKDLVAIVLERDVTTYGRQHEAFKLDPHATLSVELGHVCDEATRTRYDQFCSSMIWGSPPPFDDAIASFVDLASYCLDVPTPKPGMFVC